MNLIQDRWIPAKRDDGTLCKIAPWEVGLDSNPVVEISAPRPDFRGALYQFLIGLVQTAYMPEDNEDWAKTYDAPPSCEKLKSVFETYKEAFELGNENGPAFMQDIDLPDKAVESEIRALLIDSPGGNTIKENRDHFVKRESILDLCDSCTATALFTLQTNAPAGGQGLRTSLRGGGPLTTIVVNSTKQSVWKTIWLNILTRELYFRKALNYAVEDIFPWMGSTCESSNNREIHPLQVSELQMYWGMPRRIRLHKRASNGVCSICEAQGPVWKSFRSKNYGTNYSSQWIHTLSPYRKQEEKDGSISLIAIKGKQGGFSYPDWLSLTLINNSKEGNTATVIRSFNEEKRKMISDNQHLVWCSGFDLDKAKARCWYDQTMPILYLPEDKRELFIEKAQQLINAASETSQILRNQVKAAWFERPKEAKGDSSYITTAFWEETENQFFLSANEVREAIIAGSDISPIMAKWRTYLIRSAERLFDRFAVQDTDEIKSMKRIAEAARALSSILYSPKTKSIHVLKEEA